MGTEIVSLSAKQKKTPAGVFFNDLVELGGVEPPSENHSSLVLHA